MKRTKLTKTAKRDIRDNASLLLSTISTAVSVASLAMVLNKKPQEIDDEIILYSELMGPIVYR